MDTPSLQVGLAQRGLKIPGIYNPDEVVCKILDRLDDGPLQIFGFSPEPAKAPAIEAARRARATQTIIIVKMFHGD